MLSASEKLTESLKCLQQLQSQGKVAVRSAELSRVHRERLVKNGFLKEVMKGWYIPVYPEHSTEESDYLVASFWEFCSDYLQDRFGDNWCLSPEQSLSLHVGNRTVPQQLVVRSNAGGNNITKLSASVSIQDVHLPLPSRSDMEQKDGLNIFGLPAALATCSPSFFRQNSVDAKAALCAVEDSSEILPHLIEGGHTVIAGRLAGAFRHIGRTQIANDILSSMKTAGYNCREDDPFKFYTDPLPLASPILSSSPLPQSKPPRIQIPESIPKITKTSYVDRIRQMWEMMK